jgi:hypothetical protein
VTSGVPPGLVPDFAVVPTAEAVGYYRDAPPGLSGGHTKIRLRLWAFLVLIAALKRCATKIKME